MRVGLFTYHFSENYGALLQAFSLRQWFLKRGIDAEFVNYHPTYVEEGGALDRPWKPSLWRKNAVMLYMKQAHLRRQVFGDREQCRSFEAFRAKHLGVSGPRLRHASEVTAQIQHYDMLVCGSDQIWNPSIQRGLDPVYFLDVPGSEGIRKVAYAPSFGRAEIESTYCAELGRLLGGLDAISVREASGLGIIEAAGQSRDAVLVVPDPTILLGSFDELIDENRQAEDTVFCYALRTDEVIRQVAVGAARQTGSLLISPRTPHQRWRNIGRAVVPGPLEWLSMLARARLVVSNSFHGVALSVLLNKPFLAVGLPGRRAGMNARVKGLLEVTGLTDRMVDSPNSDEVNRLIETPIDWKATNLRLAEARAKAEDFLELQIDAVRARFR